MPPVEILRALLRYDKRTGHLYWRKRTAKHYSNPKRLSSWNSRHAGKRALSTVSRGYLVGPLLGRTEFAHRVIWCMIHGEPPQDQIDHIDGNRSNNRLTNLRAVTNAENSKNAKLYKSNTSGRTGVGFDKGRKKWISTIKANGIAVHLGRFDSFDAACKARDLAEPAYGYHSNHGRTK